MKDETLNGLEVVVTDTNCHIKNSYKVNNEMIMLGTIDLLLYHHTQFNVRTRKSYLAEWKAHNIMYKFGFQRERTKDVDLNINEEKWKRFLYHIISWFFISK